MINWKDVYNYEGMYQVSDTGLVRSLARTVKGLKGGEYTIPSRILKTDASNTTTNTSYLRVTLCTDGVTERVSVHRLVATHFVVGRSKERDIINHIDNDATNNTATNLEWCSHSENMIHAQRQGRLFASQSKGGIAGTVKSVAKRTQNMESLVGTQVNGWSVGSKFTTRSKHHYIQSTCTCGVVRDVAYETLFNGKANACSKKCGKPFRS